jgi:CheY-like chemotaxis protein
MKNSIVVWVVDDNAHARQAATKCAEQAGMDLGLSLTVSPVRSLAWSERPKEGLPNLVVLDLIEEGEPLGIDFYDRLREAEDNAQREATRAFVIIWSDYISTENEPRGFAATHASDDRLINLNLGYKSPGSIDSLREKIKGTLGRIWDEDLCSLEAENLET